MVAIVSSMGLGLNLGSLATLGREGQIGTPAHGSSGEGVYVNVATGNLVLQTQDDRLAGRGPDAVALRTYDARGNLRDVADGRVHMVMEYDKAGNRTRIINSVDYKGVNGEAIHGADRYFKYDEMNRQVVVDAVDASGGLGEQSHAIAYDKAGNRITDVYWGRRVYDGSSQLKISSYDSADRASYNKALSQVNFSSDTGYRTETYRYDRLNRLTSVVRDGVQIDVRLYDAADRVVQSGPYTPLTTQYHDLMVTGVAPEEANGKDIRLSRYDANGRVVYQMVRRADGRRTTDISWDSTVKIGGQTPAGYDDAGNQLGYVVENIEGGYVNEYRNVLARYDGYQVQEIKGTSTRMLSGSTFQQFDVNGQLVGVTDTRQPMNNRTLVNDAQGRTLFVEQYGHVRRQLIVNGEVLGIYGVGVDPVKPLGHDEKTNFANLNDFNFSYSRISASYPNASPGGYIVRSGESLQDIARAAYGDSSMWYRIAEANGLESSSDMRVGQTLNIPNAVGTSRNDGGTFKPYDPSRIEGDKTPHLPMPQADKGCGGVGKVLMAVVAVAATIFTAGMLTPGAAGLAGVMKAGIAAVSTAAGFAATGAVAVMAAGAVGSIAGQLVGLATGDVQRFNWKQVALSGIGAGVSGGLLQGGLIPDLPSKFLGVMAHGAMSNAITQGIGVVTGLQKKFSGQAVAASAVGAGVGAVVGEGLGMHARGSETPSFGEQFGKRLLTGLLAGAAAAVVRGGKVAVQQVAVDAFGNALGLSMVQGATSGTNRAITEASAANTPFPNAEQVLMSDRGGGSLPDLAEMDALNRKLAGSYQPGPDDFVDVAANGGPYTVSFRRPMSKDEFRLSEIRGREKTDRAGVDYVPDYGELATAMNGTPAVVSRAMTPAEVRSMGAVKFAIGTAGAVTASGLGPLTWPVAALSADVALTGGMEFVDGTPQRSPLGRGLQAATGGLLSPDAADMTISAIGFGVAPFAAYRAFTAPVPRYSRPLLDTELVEAQLFTNVPSGVNELAVATSSRIGGTAYNLPLIRPATQTRTVSLGNGDAVYVLDDLTGDPLLADGRIVGPHPGRGKGYVPDPVGGRTPGDHRGHLIPEGGVADQAVVNNRYNVISEAPASNLGLKKSLDYQASKLASDHPTSVVRLIAQPIRDIGQTRPSAVTYYLTKDGQLVRSLSILNK